MVMSKRPPSRASSKTINSPFIKSFLRQVLNTLPRFLSILVITIVGVMFFIGLRLTGPYMVDSTERYLDEVNFMDIQLLSTMGFDADDIVAIEQTAGVEVVAPGYFSNVLACNGPLEISVQIISFDDSTQRPINAPHLLRGRLPQRASECLAEEGWLSETGTDIGSTVSFVSGTDEPITDTLTTGSFTIVGTATTPLYMDLERGSSEVGNGSNEFFFLVLPQAFSLEVYTLVFLQVNLGNLDTTRFDAAYHVAVAPVANALEATANWRSVERFDSIVKEAEVKLADARAEIADGYRELADAQQELADALVSLEDGWAELEDARSTLDSSWVSLNNSRATLDNGWAELESARAELDGNWATYQTEFQKAEDGYLYGFLSQAEYDLAMLQLGAVKQQLEAGEASYAGARLKLESGESAYSSGLAELLSAEASYADGVASYDEARAKYEDGLASYEKERGDALVELADAESELTAAEADLRALKPPHWYVLENADNAGFRNISQQCQQIEAIATLIPVLFYLIAALVSMTSMTRLVDSDRTIIGTYKALGYPSGLITMRYLIYAFVASLFGGILGIFLGSYLFPTVIFNAYQALFSIPSAPILYSWPLSLLAILFALVCAVGPAVSICLRILRETPASAMRPLAPRPGKRIFLERIKPLWSRLSFLRKITARNLLRYKRRALMTILGVTGCTALVFTGFGLHDSIATVGPKQFGQIINFDVSITFNPAAQQSDLDELFAFVDNSPELTSTTLIRRETAEIITSSLKKDLFLVAVADTTNLLDYYYTKPRDTDVFEHNQPLQLDDSGVFLSELIAQQVGVGIGDVIVLRNLDKEEGEFTVAGIVENYVYHYVYMTSKVYAEGFGRDFEANQILGLLRDDSISLPDSITDFPAVTGVLYTAENAQTYARVTDVLGFVMVVLIVSAAALLFVVLFSLNTINREERARELASIKVLGFFNRELASYIYREGLILTVLGIVLGVLLGIVLERHVITTIQIDFFMFSTDILWTSYFFSIVLTALFAVVVNLLLYRPLTQIDMVAALKAIE